MPSAPVGRAAKALTVFFAGLTAAKPLYGHRPMLAARQDDAATTAPSAAAATTTAEIVSDVASSIADSSAVAGSEASVTATATETGTGTLDLPSDVVVAAAAVSATVSGTARQCSVQSVTAFTSTAYVTMLDDATQSTTSPLYTLSLQPGLGCTCDDGWMAGIGTSMGTDGLQTITCQFGDDENPAIATQTSAMVPNPTYHAEWCETINKDDPDKLIDFWENKNITHVLDSYTRGKEDDWWINLIGSALKDKGNVKYTGCGVVGSQDCDLNLDCDEFVDRGMGAEYWIMSAVESFHSKINVAHEFLQDTTLDNLLGLDTIASDFSAPKSTGMNGLSILASLLSAGIFLAGSVTGVGGVIAAEVGLAATAARAAAQGAARAARKSAAKETNLAKKDVLIENAIKQDAIASAAGKRVDAMAGGTRITGALGAGLWTTASTFTMIGAFSDPEGQVEASDLTPLLHEMFKGARDQMAALGKTAMGRGGDYSSLPATNGSGFAVPLSPESYIAGFFSDGKFLLSDSNQVFNESIQNSYGTFKTKVVDQALQTGGMQIFALTDLDNEEECKDEDLWGGYGAEWMDPLGDGTMQCMQMYRDNHGGSCNALTSCDWVVPEKEIFDKLTKDYGFNMQNYYAAAAQCNKAKLKDNMPDYVTMALDGTTPACYYNIKAQKAERYKNCHGRDNLLCDAGFNFSDF